MGSSYSSYNDPTAHNAWLRKQAAIKGAETRRVNKHRMEVADKIVMAVVDRICLDIIRPGPTPAERECYVVAQELRDHAPHLRELVTAILKIDAEEPADGDTER